MPLNQLKPSSNWKNKEKEMGEGRKKKIKREIIKREGKDERKRIRNTKMEFIPHSRLFPAKSS
jgi:hypothetical protein